MADANDESIRVPQFYLSTLVVMLLVGGVLLWLNVTSRSFGVNDADTEWGFPLTFYHWNFPTAHGSASPLGILCDVAVFFVSLWIVGRSWERFVLKQCGPQRESAVKRLTT